MGSTPLPIAARFYALCLRLLPPSVWREDSAEMTLAFAELWNETQGQRRRLWLGVRMFARLASVVGLEWIDAVGLMGMERTGGWEMMGWGKNMRYAMRTLRKAPAFTVTTVALIGLGVGAVTMIFTLVDHVLLRPLPYPDAERLVTVENGSHSGVVFREMQALNGVDAWAAGTVDDANLTGEGDPIRIDLASVSDGFFPLFGARPEIGRLLTAGDPPDVVVVSNGTWQSVFGGDPALIGRTIRVDGTDLTVAGVLTADFEPPQGVLSAGVAAYRPVDWTREAFSSPGYRSLQVAGRLASGVAIADVQNQLDAAIERVSYEYPDQMLNREGNWEPLPVVGLQASSVQRVRTGLNLLFGAVALLLLVACLNVAHLFLARGLGRVQEMAVRRALGAGAGGLAQQLFTESVVIGLAGGVVGLAIAWVGLDTFMALNPDALPRASAVGLDLRVAGFAAALAIGTAVLFGLLPAMRTVGSDLTNELKGASRTNTGGRGTRRVRGSLVVAEVALSLVLVAQAGLLFKSFVQVQAHDPGFETAGVWTVPLTIPQPESLGEYIDEMDAVLAELNRVPGVLASAYGLTQPFEVVGRGRCCWSTSRIQVDGVEQEGVRLFLHPVSRGYFETLQLPMVAGSLWSLSAEEEDPMPAVVTERLAIDLFGSAQDAMGRVFGRPDREFRVTGVAGDAKHYGLDQPDPTAAYVPMSRLSWEPVMAHVAVRVSGEPPAGFARSIREAIWSAAPDLPIPTVRAMDEWVADSMAGRRFDSAIFGAFGLAALLLAAAGLYGTLLYNVRQQRRELGIRLALGAARSRVELEVVGGGVRLAAAGVLIGVVGAVWGGRLLESRLYEVTAADPVALGSAAVVLLLAATVASWLPARRAARTDPLQTLKAE